MSPVLVALDLATTDDAVDLARRLADHVGGFKVGLGLIMSDGPGAVAAIAELGLPVFADAKLHDIPNTVAAGARALGSHGARWVTVHPGGRAMVEAAVSSLAEGSDGACGVLVVTVLTSLDDSDLRDIGVSRDIGGQVEALSRLAADSGAEGVVCPPGEVHRARRGGPRLTVITPGIRPGGSPIQDQKRVATPGAAMAAGADWIVVGRAITRAEDPVAAAIAVGAEAESSSGV